MRKTFEASRFSLMFLFALLHATLSCAQGPGGGGPGGGGPGGGGPRGGGPGGGSTSGRVTATTCGSATTCASDGSSNYHSLSLSFSTSTGIFTGTLTTNGCVNYARTYNGAPSSFPSTGSCITQTFPAPAFTNTPIATPLLSNIGYTLNGVNLYGPFEAGFTLGQACSVSAGSADAGVDVSAAEMKIKYECLNAGGATKQMFVSCKFSHFHSLTHS